MTNFIFNLQRFGDVYNGTASNDYIVIDGEEFDMGSTINGGAGGDTISVSHSDFITIDGGTGNDSIYVSNGDSSSINGNAGNDSIVINAGEGFTINGGAGNDLISLNSDTESNLIQYNEGDGNDTIYGFNLFSTLQIGGGYGTYSSQTSGSDLIVTVGEGKITLVGAAYSFTIAGKDVNFLLMEGTNNADYFSNVLANATINALGGNDTVENNGSNVIINAGAGNDSITNSGDNVTVDGGSGNDLINNSWSSNYALLSGGEGKDSIYNYREEYSTIDGGAGDDLINGSYWNSSISGGAGNDLLNINVSYNGRINAGTGDDTVRLGSETSDNLIQYAEGDGNDLIYGFNSSSTLQIGDGTGTYSYKKSNGDIIVTAGEGSVTLSDAVDLSTVNIVGEYVNPLLIVGTEGADSINNTLDSAMILALGGKDRIVNRRYSSNSSNSEGYNNVTIDGGSGNDTILNDYYYWYGVTGGIGTTVFYGSEYYYAGNYLSINGGSGNDYISSGSSSSTQRGTGSYSTLEGGNGDDTIVNLGNYVSINGGVGEDSIENSGTNSTVDAGDGNDFIKNTSNNVIISGGDGNDTIKNIGDNTYSIIIVGGAGDDSISNTNTDANIIYNYSSGDGFDTISGFNEVSTLQIGDGNGTYSAIKSGSDLIITVGIGQITLQGAADLSEVNISGNDKTNLGWTLNGTTATYGTWKEILVTVNGVKSVNGLNLSGNVVTVSNAALNQGTVTISDGYTLKLGSDVPSPVETKEGWGKISSGKATYNFDSMTEGYTLADNQIIYTAATDAKSFTISGIKSTDGINVKGTTVTLTADNLNKKTVTISDGYTLKLGSDVSSPATTKANWSKVSSGKATYNFASTTEGYTLADNKISYTAPIAAKSFTLSGIKSTDGITVSGTTVTLTANNLNKKTVTISDGYTLKLGSDVSSPATTKANWSKVSSGKATYNFDSTTEGYTLADNKITYTAATDAKSFTISGIKSTDGITVSGTTVTLTANNLNKKTVTISDGYTLKLASDVTKSATKKAAWSLDGTTATYKDSYKTAGYTLADNEITYSKATTTDTLATVKGVKSVKGLSVSGNTIKLTSNLANKVTVSGEYNFDFASSYKNATITSSNGGDTITARGTKISVNGGKGDDTIKMLGTGTVTGGKGSDVFYYKSNGANVIKDYTDEDKISIASGTAKVTTSGDDVIFTVGKGKITLTGGADKTVTYTDKSGDHIYPTVKIKGKAITLTENYLDDKFNVADYGNALQTIDASAVVLDLNIIGNKLANKIIGSSQNDTIDGGKGNDSIIGGKGNDTLYGGAGSDVFIYNKGDGNDTIADYTEDDFIEINDDAVAKVNKKSGNAILTLESKKKITIIDGADKVLNYTGAIPPVDFNAKGTGATLTANYSADDFKIADYADYKDSVVTIDASAVDQDINIVANKKNNKIIGGAGNDQIDGGNGNDSINGGKGADVLIGGKGSDTLEGGAGNDTLKGGDGADVFVYNKGDGNDVIADYAEDDLVSIKSDTVSKFSTSKNKKDIIFTLASKKKITITGGAGQVISYVDDKGENTYPKVVKFNNAGSSVTLTADYNKDEFNIADYADYKDSVVTINASAVGQDIEIIANKKANRIIGSANNDSLWGGKGNDTLFGGDGADTFVYQNGDGKDVITDFTSMDRIMIYSGKVSGYSVNKSDDVTFKIGSGSITVTDGADKFIEVVNKSGKLLTHYSPKG